MNVQLGDTTPEKNSASNIRPGNPTVIAAKIDGTGAVIQLQSLTGGSDCATVWQLIPVPGSGAPAQGSIDITLSDAGTADLYIQRLDVCQNGIPGKMYFLCSDFIPDP